MLPASACRPACHCLYRTLLQDAIHTLPWVGRVKADALDGTLLLARGELHTLRSLTAVRGKTAGHAALPRYAAAGTFTISLQTSVCGSDRYPNENHY